jgi:hypothetical protein
MLRAALDVRREERNRIERDIVLLFVIVIVIVIVVPARVRTGDGSVADGVGARFLKCLTNVGR